MLSALCVSPAGLWSAGTAYGPRSAVLTVVEPKSRQKVLLVGTMHYNPTSIELARSTVVEEGEASRLRAVLVESCPTRWNATLDKLPSNSVTRWICDNEMQAAAEAGQQFGIEVDLGDQTIEDTGSRAAQLLALTLAEALTPFAGGWGRIASDFRAALQQVRSPTTEGLSPVALLNAPLLLGFPISAVRYPLALFVKSPLLVFPAAALYALTATLDASAADAAVAASASGVEPSELLQAAGILAVEVLFLGRWRRTRERRSPTPAPLSRRRPLRPRRAQSRCMYPLGRVRGADPFERCGALAGCYSSASWRSATTCSRATFVARACVRSQVAPWWPFSAWRTATAWPPCCVRRARSEREPTPGVCPASLVLSLLAAAARPPSRPVPRTLRVGSPHGADGTASHSGRMALSRPLAGREITRDSSQHTSSRNSQAPSTVCCLWPVRFQSSPEVGPKRVANEAAEPKRTRPVTVRATKRRGYCAFDPLSVLSVIECCDTVACRCR